MVLVLVLALLMASYASSLRAYLDQHHHLAALRASIASSQAEVDRLSAEKRRWKDPDYVKSVAHARFGWVMPGEVGFRVLDADGRPLDATDSLSAPGSVTARSRPQWWQSAWGSVVAAGKPEVKKRKLSPGHPDHASPDRRQRLRGVTSPDPDHGTALSSTDAALVEAQLGRPARSVHEVGHRCPCGNPDVLVTEPRLADGTPFPTTFYLTCPRAASVIGTLEASGLMAEMTERLAHDPDLAAGYKRAHRSFLARRLAIGHVPEIDGVSAGGMPTRVKCLHVLAAQSLAQGPGVNPLGDQVLAALGAFWSSGPCVTAAADQS